MHSYQLLHSHIAGSMPFRFFWATLYIIYLLYFNMTHESKSIKIVLRICSTVRAINTRLYTSNCKNLISRHSFNDEMEESLVDVFKK